MSRLVSTTVAVTVALFTSIFASQARAEETGCSSAVSRSSVSRCAIGASAAVRVASLDGEVAAARLRAASPWLPSNPTLAVSLASRRSDAQSGTNWYATLSQEIEIGGQRAARRDSAEADIKASSERLIAARRAVAVAAWNAYFGVLGARDELALAQRMEALSVSVAEATQAFADRGSVPGLDADLADVAASKAKQSRIVAEGRLATSKAILASLLGTSPQSLAVDGELEPLRDIEAKAHRAADIPRPELVALEWQAKSFEARSRAYERQRIPSLTLSGFVQNDGFNERVLGVGLSLPIPLPYPVGRTYSGEIAEARASANAVRAEVTRAQVELRRDSTVAFVDYASKVNERDAVAPDKYDRAEGTLTTIANEVKAGRLAPRDAFVAQQTLIELLQGRVRARYAACIASVELARAAGLPLEDGEP